MWKPNLLFVSKAAAALVVTVAAFGAEPLIETKKLESLAVEARTPAEHATVSRHFLLRAEALDAKAAEHEANVRKLTKSAGTMGLGMAPGDGDKDPMPDPEETTFEQAHDRRVVSGRAVLTFQIHFLPHTDRRSSFGYTPVCFFPAQVAATAHGG
ncbi:MAG: hypothetical protein IT167_31605 [Bryobacterales bacterium]|nr:hypothetical protein [Bryobacterales bacterium]